MTCPSNSDRKIILLGAGGHASVLVALLRATAAKLIGVCDPELFAQGVTNWRGIKVLGGDDVLAYEDPVQIWLVNGIGQVISGTLRADIYYRFSQAGFVFPPLVHPAAWVAPDVQLSEGVQIMAGAVVQPGVSIGPNTILNTGCRVDHDCVVGADVHIAPGATICGGVVIGDGTFIGAGSTIVQGIKVGIGAVVAAGATLRTDLQDYEILLPPASERRLRKKREGKEN